MKVEQARELRKVDDAGDAGGERIGNVVFRYAGPDQCSIIFD